MLSKPQLFFKKFIRFSAFQKTLALSPSLFSLPRQSHPLHFVSYYQISSSFKPLSNYHKDDLALVDGLSREQLAYANEIMEKYSTSRDLEKFDHNDADFIISLLQNFAIKNKAQGDLLKAYSYIKEAEEVCKQANINDTLFVANNHSIKTSLCLNLNDTETDIEYHFDEVDRICKLLSRQREARSLRVQTLLTRGDYHFRRNEKDKALEFLNEILKNTRHVVDEVLPNLLVSTYEVMGVIYKGRGELDKAIDIWTKGLEIAVPHSGENNSKVFFFYCDLAEAFYQTQRPQEALPYANKGLEIALNIYPPDHFEIGWCNDLLGCVLVANNDLAKALKAYKKAIKIHEKQHKQDFYALGEIYFKAGKINRQLENDSEASLFFNKSTQMLAKRDEPDIIEVYLEKARELQENERLKDAEIYLKGALEAWKNQMPNDKQKFEEINSLLQEVVSQK